MQAVMKRQDPFRIKRFGRLENVRAVFRRGEAVNRSPVTALTFCMSEECGHDVGGLRKVFKREIARVGYDVPLLDAKTICPGECTGGPYIGLVGPNIFYSGVKAHEVEELLYETLFNNRYYFLRAALDPLKATDSRIVFDYKEQVMVALEPEASMFEWAKYLFEFNAAESCGKCTPCRWGCFHVTEILKAMAEGRATENDLAQLEALVWLMDQGAYCTFAAKVATPIRMTLDAFRDEYESLLTAGDE
jgi:hypothetical protein